VGYDLEHRRAGENVSETKHAKQHARTQTRCSYCSSQMCVCSHLAGVAHEGAQLIQILRIVPVVKTRIQPAHSSRVTPPNATSGISTVCRWDLRGTPHTCNIRQCRGCHPIQPTHHSLLRATTWAPSSRTGNGTRSSLSCMLCVTLHTQMRCCDESVLCKVITHD